jgi:hypothetical protein
VAVDQRIITSAFGVSSCQRNLASQLAKSRYVKSRSDLSVHLTGYVANIEQTVGVSAFRASSFQRNGALQVAISRGGIRTVHLSRTCGVNPGTWEKLQQGKGHRHIGIRQIMNPEDKDLVHFETAKFEIPTGGTLHLRGPADVISSNESIGASAFRRSWRRDVWVISIREIAKRDHDRPFVGTRGRDQRNRECPERTAPLENQRSGNRGVRNTCHQNSRNPDSRYPIKIWTVRSQHDLDR